MKRKITKKQENKEKQEPKRKILEGVVVKNKMDKTIVVKVTTKKRHPLYSKIMKRSKRYKVHSEKKIQEGKKVKIEQCRPISKEKKWKVVN